MKPKFFICLLILLIADISNAYYYGYGYDPNGYGYNNDFYLRRRVVYIPPPIYYQPEPRYVTPVPQYYANSLCIKEDYKSFDSYTTDEENSAFFIQHEQNFYYKLQKAILNDDKHAFADLITYPLHWISSGGDVYLQNPEQVIQNYYFIMNSTTKSALLNITMGNTGASTIALDTEVRII